MLVLTEFLKGVNFFSDVRHVLISDSLDVRFQGAEEEKSVCQPSFSALRDGRRTKLKRLRMSSH